MDVVVIGGTGFLGRHLLEYLHKQDISACSVSRSPDHEFLRKYAPSIIGYGIDDPSVWSAISTARAIVYLAGSSRPGSSWSAPGIDIDGSVGPLARFVRRTMDTNASCRFVYASSGGTVYGRSHRRPIAEDSPLSPVTSYALSKQLCENTMEFFGRLGLRSFVILRIANPVGRWQSDGRHGFVSAALRCAVSGVPLTVYGDGNNVRDYFDADELAELFALVCFKDDIPSRVYNIGLGSGSSETDVVRVIEGAVGRKMRVQYEAARPFDLRYAVLDVSRAGLELGWRAKLDLGGIVRKLLKTIDA